MTAWETICRNAGEALVASGVENGRQEARWLVEFAVKNGCSPEQFDEMVRRRVNGEPLQYIMGSCDFYGFELMVGKGVLIPRPETEVLVEIAEQLLAADGTVLDLCTGSGAIALALAALKPNAQITGVDISPDALFYARSNQKRLKVENVRWLEGDLFAPLEKDETFDMITANPPYVAPTEYEQLETVVKDYEPKLALVAENEGLAIIQRIIDGAKTHLDDGGWLLMEIGEEQGGRVLKMLSDAGFRETRIQKDYAGKDRIAVGKR